MSTIALRAPRAQVKYAPQRMDFCGEGSRMEGDDEAEGLLKRLSSQTMKELSPRLEARVAGALYVLIILLGGFAEVRVRQGLVAGDPSTPGPAILAHENPSPPPFLSQLLPHSL